ncbi:Pentatricopeptide repeat-containing protein At3g42630 [Linum grandiflorum]
MRSQGLVPDNSTVSALMLCYAENGLFYHAESIMDEMLNSCFIPSMNLVSELMDAYSKIGLYGEVAKLVDQFSSSRHKEMLPKVFAMAISCYGKGGQLGLMEDAMKEMVSKGVRVGSSVGNAFILYYSIHSSLAEMEAAYHRVKRSRILIEEEAIRAMSSAYIRNRKFYQLGEFVKDVGLRRKNVGNLLWNLLLVSYAARFKMKSLQREFVNMVESGFAPDLTTFNIRAIAFSKMSLVWDLHLSLEHMRHDNVDPDLVTYGCVADAYLERKLGRNLDFAFRKLNLEECPVVQTDTFVFDVLGKGEFHASSEAFMEFTRKRKWSYKDLLAIYVRKQHRCNQIFWNY